MNKQKNFFAIFLAVVMMAISCSQGNLEIVNIDENMPEAETTLTISINSVTSRTVRPEVVKWKVELFKNENERIAAANESKIWASRTLNAGNTSTTFTNIACAVYDVKISGYADKDCKKKVLFGERMVDMNDGENNLCVVNVEDYFGDGKGNLKVNIAGVFGLSELLDNNNNEEQTVEFTLFPLKTTAETEKPNGDIISLTYNEGTLTGQTVLPAGIYEMSGNCGDINLVQDPIVNIYADTTTDIYWEWDLESDTVDKIDIEKKLAETIIPVWTAENVDIYQNSDIGSALIKKAGFLRGNALFAEPEGENLDLDFKNFCFDNAGDLWILHSDLNENENEVFKISKVADSELGGISLGATLDIKSGNNEVISNMERCKFTDIAFMGNGILLLGEVEAGASYFLYYAKREDGYYNASICQQFDLSNFFGGGTVTSIATKGSDVYIATATKNAPSSENICANIYKGTISTNDDGEVTLDNLSLNSLLGNYVLTIKNFCKDESVVDNFSLDSPESFMISDMYIDDDTALYFTAGCVVAKYYGSSGIYYSFGGLFKYSGNNLYSYGIDKSTECIYKYYEQPEYYLYNMQQAVNENDEYFAGPRYIIPHKSNGSELFVIDSGFYADINADESTPPTEPIILNKRNRIFVFDRETKDLSFTDVIDSVNFDFERMSEKYYSWNGS